MSHALILLISFNTGRGGGKNKRKGKGHVARHKTNQSSLLHDPNAFFSFISACPPRAGIAENTQKNNTRHASIRFPYCVSCQRDRLLFLANFHPSLTLCTTKYSSPYYISSATTSKDDSLPTAHPKSRART